MAVQTLEAPGPQLDALQPWSWLPTSYTGPLRSESELVSDGPRLRAAVAAYWRTPDGQPLVLDPWQTWLIDHVLERYPDDWHVPELRGRLRFRQVVISMGRQNGKSVLGAIFGFYGLAMHDPGPVVISLARSVDQANIVYERVLHVIKSNAALTKLFKPTGTRGITQRAGGGTYRVKPAKGDAIQGLPVSTCIFDELHLSKMELWSAVVNGQRTRRNAILVGITTAGDDDSELLKDLYRQGQLALAGEAERFGFFLWEAPEGATIDTPGAIESANPSVACGRVPVEVVREDVRLTPEADQQRYVLNRFVSSSNSWLPMTAWRDCGNGGPEDLAAITTYTVDRTPGWEWATIVATTKTDQDQLQTEVVASLGGPHQSQLVAACVQLGQLSPNAVFVMDSLTLGSLAQALKDKGLTVRTMKLADRVQASAAAYAAIISGRVSHANDELLTRQIPRGRRKNVGDGWVLSRADSDHIDAAMATVYGLYAADTDSAVGFQLF